MKKPVQKTIEIFENPCLKRDYEIVITQPEFSSLCPITGLPDFGTIRITYSPDRKCLELKSLKMYLLQYRNHGAFYEKVTNTILDDLVKAIKPRRMTVEGIFNTRGGIQTTVVAEYKKRKRK